MSVRLTVASVALTAAGLLSLEGTAFAATPLTTHQAAASATAPADGPGGGPSGGCQPGVSPCPGAGHGYDPNDPHDNPDGS
jgi:hypothetical protein